MFNFDFNSALTDLASSKKSPKPIIATFEPNSDTEYLFNIE